jgi:mRNA interferase RelE/StbE
VYRITFTPAADRDLDRLPRNIYPRVESAILALAVNPKPHGYEKMSGSKGEYRIKVGQYRVRYFIDDAQGLVTVTRAGHRSEVYKDRS